MEIITLVENDSCDDRLTEEFGLSLLIKTKKKSILFDMGKSDHFWANASALGENLGGIDCAVISHAHYDHGGGLEAFVNGNASAPIYIGHGASGDYFAHRAVKMPPFIQPVLYPLVRKSLSFCKYVGLDKEIISQNPDRFVVVEDNMEVADNVYLLPTIEQTVPIPFGNRFLFEKKMETLQPDSFVHELIMVIREEDGLALFTGCGHLGIVNMVNTVEHYFSNDKIKAVIGGFHLALQPGKSAIAGKREDIVAIAQHFRDRGITYVLSGHCTGDDACDILQEEMGQRFSRLNTGSKHTI